MESINPFKKYLSSASQKGKTESDTDGFSKDIQTKDIVNKEINSIFENPSEIFDTNLSDDEAKVLKDIFHSYDEDENGILTEQEIKPLSQLSDDNIDNEESIISAKDFNTYKTGVNLILEIVEKYNIPIEEIIDDKSALNQVFKSYPHNSSFEVKDDDNILSFLYRYINNSSSAGIRLENILKTYAEYYQPIHDDRQEFSALNSIGLTQGLSISDEYLYNVMYSIEDLAALNLYISPTNPTNGVLYNVYNYNKTESIDENGNTVLTISYMDANDKEVITTTTFVGNSTIISAQTQKIDDETTTVNYNSETGAFVVTYPDATQKTSEQLVLERMMIDEIDNCKDNGFLQLIQNAYTDDDLYNVILTYCCGDTETTNKLFNYLQENESNKYYEIETEYLYNDENDQEIEAIVSEFGLADDYLINELQSAPTKRKAFDVLYDHSPKKAIEIFEKLFPQDDYNYWNNRNAATIAEILYSNIGDKFVVSPKVLELFTAHETIDKNTFLSQGYYINNEGQVCTYDTEIEQGNGVQTVTKTIKNPQGQEKVFKYDYIDAKTYFDFVSGEYVEEPSKYVIYDGAGNTFEETPEQFYKRQIVEQSNTYANYSEGILSTEDIQERYIMLAEQDARLGSSMLTYMKEVNSQGLFDWLINELELTTYSQDRIKSEFEAMGNLKNAILKAQNGDLSVAQDAENELNRRLQNAETPQETYDILVTYYGYEENNKDLILDIMRQTMCVDSNDTYSAGIVNVYIDETTNKLLVDYRTYENTSQYAIHPTTKKAINAADYTYSAMNKPLNIETIKETGLASVHEYELTTPDKIYTFWSGGKYNSDSIEKYKTALDQYQEMNNIALEATIVEDIFLQHGIGDSYDYLVEFYQGDEDKAIEAFNGYLEGIIKAGGNSEALTIAVENNKVLRNETTGEILLNTNGFYYSGEQQVSVSEFMNLFGPQINSYYMDYGEKGGYLEQKICEFAQDKPDFNYDEKNEKSYAEQYIEHCSKQYADATVELYGNNVVADIVNTYCHDMENYSQNISRAVSLALIAASVVFPGTAVTAVGSTVKLLKLAMYAGYADNVIDLFNMATNDQQADNDYGKLTNQFVFEYIMKKGYMCLGGVAGKMTDGLVGTFAQTKIGNYIAKHPVAQILLRGTTEATIETGICVPYTLALNSIQGKEFNLGEEFWTNFIYDFLPYSRTLSGNLQGLKGWGFKLTGEDGNKYYWNAESGDRVYLDEYERPLEVHNFKGNVLAKYSYTNNGGYSVRNTASGDIKTFDSEGRMISYKHDDVLTKIEYDENKIIVTETELDYPEKVFEYEDGTLKSLIIDDVKIDIKLNSNGTPTATVNGKAYELANGFSANMLIKCIEEANGDVAAGVKLAHDYSTMSLSIGNVKQYMSTDSCWICAPLNAVANDAGWSQGLLNDITYVAGNTFKISIGDKEYQFEYKTGDNVAEKIYESYQKENPGLGLTTEFMDAIFPGCEKLVMHGANPDAIDSVKTILNNGSGLVTFNIETGVDGSSLVPKHAYTVTKIDTDGSITLKDTQSNEITLSKEEFELISKAGNGQFAGRVVAMENQPRLTDGTSERMVGETYKYYENNFGENDAIEYLKSILGTTLESYANDADFITYCKNRNIDLDDKQAVEGAISVCDAVKKLFPDPSKSATETQIDVVKALVDAGFDMSYEAYLKEVIDYVDQNTKSFKTTENPIKIYVQQKILAGGQLPVGCSSYEDYYKKIIDLGITGDEASKLIQRGTSRKGNNAIIKALFNCTNGADISKFLNISDENFAKYGDSFATLITSERYTLENIIEYKKFCSAYQLEKDFGISDYNGIKDYMTKYPQENINDVIKTYKEFVQIKKEVVYDTFEKYVNRTSKMQADIKIHVICRGANNQFVYAYNGSSLKGVHSIEAAQNLYDVARQPQGGKIKLKMNSNTGTYPEANVRLDQNDPNIIIITLPDGDCWVKVETDEAGNVTKFSINGHEKSWTTENEYNKIFSAVKNSKLIKPIQVNKDRGQYGYFATKEQNTQGGFEYKYWQCIFQGDKIDTFYPYGSDKIFDKLREVLEATAIEI